MNFLPELLDFDDFHDVVPQFEDLAEIEWFGPLIVARSALESVLPFADCITPSFASHGLLETVIAHGILSWER